MIATYSSAQTTPMAAAVIRAGTKDPLAWTMKPVTGGARSPPKKPPKIRIAPRDAVVFAGAATEAIAQAEELATYPRNIAAEISATARALFSTNAAATVQAAIPSRDTVIG